MKIYILYFRGINFFYSEFSGAFFVLCVVNI